MTTVVAPSPTQVAMPGGTAATGNQTLGQADFLRLLTAQMTQQDPLNPLDNNAFVAQMAQFSQVSGLAEINQSLAAITSLLRGSPSGELAGWIGHAALVDSPTAMPLDDGNLHGSVSFDQPAKDVVLNLTDAAGNNVGSQMIGDVPSGEQSFSMTPPAGSVGPFHITLSSAQGTDGVLSTWSQIVGVRSPAAGSAARLITAAGDIAPQSIRRLG